MKPKAGLVQTVLLVAAMAPSAALAEDNDERARAKSLFEEGVRLTREGRWKKALQKFEASRELVDRPSTTFNIGTVLVRLKRPLEALSTFRAYLDGAEQQADPEGADAARSLMEEAEAMIAHLDMTVTPPSSEVVLDDEALPGPGPVYAVRVNPGVHRIGVRAENHQAKTSEIDLKPGGRRSLTIALTEVTAPDPRIAAAPPPVDGPPSVEATPDEADSMLESPAFWIVAGAVVVIGAVVIVGLAAGSGTDSPYEGTAGRVLEGLGPN